MGPWSLSGVVCLFFEVVVEQQTGPGAEYPAIDAITPSGPP
jgi:hypothetical protein